MFFDVGIETAGGDVGHGEGGAAEHAGLADFIGDALVALEAEVECFFALGEADGDDGFGHFGAVADLDGFAVELGLFAAHDGPSFVLRGVEDDADEELFGFALAGGDGDAEVGDAEEVIYGAVDGIDDPLDIAIAASFAAFFAEDGVIGEAGEDHVGDELLALHIELELDVVALHFVHREFGAEVFFDHFACGVRGFSGGGEEVVHFGAWGDESREMCAINSRARAVFGCLGRGIV